VDNIDTDLEEIGFGCELVCCCSE